MNNDVKPISNKVLSMLDDLKKSFDNNFSTKVHSIDNKSIFMYVCIIGAAIFVSQRSKIRLSNIFYILIAIIICYYIYSKKKIKAIEFNKELEIKKTLVIPEPQNIDEYPDMIEFVYDIKEFYYINANAFYSMIKNIDNYFELYDQMTNNIVLYKLENVEVAIEYSRLALNDLQSIIYNMDTSNIIMAKFEHSMRRLHKLFRKYNSYIINIANKNFNDKNLYTNSKYYSEYGPRESNYYSMDPVESVFQFF
jgi:hypothetical protein